MKVGISPEPTPEEREALERALASLDARRDGPSMWWQAGIRESTGPERDEP